MHETRSAAAGSTTSASSGSDDEPSRPSQQAEAASGDQDQSGWRSRDWGWFGLLGLVGLLGLLRKGRYRREMYPYTPSAGDVAPHGAGVYESSADVGRRRQMS
jgi:MYXO-CTERM domain-containing protein